MRIAFHAGESVTRGGGMHAYLRHMGQALRQEGHEVLLLSEHAQFDAREAESSGMRLLEMGPATPASAARAHEALREWGADWVEAPDHGGAAAALACLENRPPLVVKMHACLAHRCAVRAHAFYHWQRGTLAIALWRARAQIRRERSLLARADAVLSPSKALLEASETQALRLPPRRAVVPNPFSAPALAAPAETSKAREPTLLFVGRLDFGKGIAYLPDILAAVARRRPDVRLEIAGADSRARGLGRLRPWLEARLARAGLAGSVHFHGPLTTEALAAAYARAWLLVLPSRWDTFPTVLLEAMAAGLPVVSSPFGGMPEMLEGTGCPIANPDQPAFAAAASDLLGDDSRREEASRRLRERVRSAYAPQLIARQYIDILSDWFGERSQEMLLLR